MRITSLYPLTGFLAVFLLPISQAAAADPAPLVEQTLWETGIFSGKLKSKVQLTPTVKGPADCGVVFGPSKEFELAPDEFLLIIDDGVDQLFVFGVYFQDARRRIEALVDPVALADDLEFLFNLDLDPEVDPEVQVEILKAKVKLKAKPPTARNPSDVLKVKFRAKFIAGGVGSAKGNLTYNGGKDVRGLGVAQEDC